MRTITVFTTYFSPYWEYGGTVRSIDGLVRQLLLQGDNVTVLTTAPDLLWEQYDQALNYPGKLSIKYYLLPGRFKFSIKYFFRSIRETACSDIVYVNGLWTWPSVSGVFLASIFKKRLILAPRGMLLKPALAYNEKIKKYFILYLLYR